MLMGVQGDLPPSVAAALAAAAREVGPSGPAAGRTAGQNASVSAAASRNGAVVVELSPRHKPASTFGVEINASPRRPQRTNSSSSPRASPSHARGGASPLPREGSPRRSSSRSRRNLPSSPSQGLSAAALKKRNPSVGGVPTPLSAGLTDV